MKRWFPLTYALNSLNRSLGMPDGYPFTLAAPVIDKLRFVHRVIAAVGDKSQPREAAAPAVGAGAAPVLAPSEPAPPPLSQPMPPTEATPASAPGATAAPPKRTARRR
jgi:hypothetical protein